MINPQLAPKATGCLLQGDDIPRVCASVSAFGAKFGCGAGTALLGLTFPHLVEKFHVLASDLGPKIFSSAGIGLIIGLVVSYQIRQTMAINLSKISLACLSIFVASCLQLLVMISGDINIICILYVLQFSAFGCVEGFTLVAFFEMWGQRIQVILLPSLILPSQSRLIFLAMDLFKSIVFFVWMFNPFSFLSK
jgi:hypothetical protein